MPDGLADTYEQLRNHIGLQMMHAHLPRRVAQPSYE